LGQSILADYLVETINIYQIKVGRKTYLVESGFDVEGGFDNGIKIRVSGETEYLSPRSPEYQKVEEKYEELSEG